MAFKIYAFAASGEWSVEAATLREANSMAQAFQLRGLQVRIYEQSVNEAGDLYERLVESNHSDQKL